MGRNFRPGFKIPNLLRKSFSEQFAWKLMILFLSFSFFAQAQEVIPTYSDYLTDNLYLLHPSMAGAANRNQIRLTARQQWFDVDNAPSLQTLSVNGRVDEKVGVGGIFFNDQNGNFSKTGAYSSFAYHLLFSRSELDLNQLSFGISVGIIQHRLDQSGFTEFDPIIGEDDTAGIYGNVDFGLSYNYLNFYAHLVAKNLLPVSSELYFSDGIPANQRKYFLSTGYVFDPSNTSWSYEPSLMFQLKEEIEEKTIDLNLKIYHTMDFGQLWGGISFRQGFEGAEYTTEEELVEKQHLRYLTPFVGVDYKRFIFGYVFSYQMNSVVLSNNGFHQITLGYDFGKNRQRYDCKCPAIN